MHGSYVGKRFFYRIRKKHNGNSILILFFLIFVFISIVIMFSKFRSLVRGEAVALARDCSRQIIAQTVRDELKSDDSYSKLVSFEKTNDGKITAVLVDTVKTNVLKENIMLKILERLRNMPKSDLSIPVGSLLKNEFFVGRGPRIHIKVSSFGFANVRFVSAFTSAGINHTRLQIAIQVDVSFSVVLPTVFENVTTSSTTIACESILIGDVPDSYTYIDDTTDDTFSKIINYAY